MNTIGIIPARYASSRFPGKPLVDIKGKPMIQRVYEQARKASGLQEVIVATDDRRIASVIANAGGKCILTSKNHRSGTDRCAEALLKTGCKYDVVVNIQGDEPFINPEQIDRLAALFSEKKVEIGTLAIKSHDVQSKSDPNKIKVVFDKNNFAVYFSRLPIPYRAEHIQGTSGNSGWYYRHIGLYAYRATILQAITKLPPSSLELSESLEQLRWIENGYRIKLAFTDSDSISVDVPDDLKKLPL